MVNLLNNPVQHWSVGGLLVTDALLLLNSFARWSAQHIRRDYNFVFHYLIKEAFQCNEDVIIFANVTRYNITVIHKILCIHQFANDISPFLLKNKER